MSSFKSQEIKINSEPNHKNTDLANIEVSIQTANNRVIKNDQIELNEVIIN